ncbi:hypothetical protein GQX74_011328 [Glossina fuscipes]|nr:hypothetical protein GQX74_011328 [Glossina fuscipes]
MASIKFDYMLNEPAMSKSSAAILFMHENIYYYQLREEKGQPLRMLGNSGHVLVMWVGRTDCSDSVATSLSRKACFSNITTALSVSDCSGKQPNKAILFLFLVLLLRMRCKRKYYNIIYYKWEATIGQCRQIANATATALLHPSPHLRTKLHELKKISFHDVGVKTLNYLDSLYQWDNLNKSKFYKSLPQIIPTLPHRANLHSILPHLVKEFVNCLVIPFVLPYVLIIAEMSSQKEYSDHILTHLIPIFKLKEPIQTHLILMQKMDLLLKLTAPEEVKLHVLPLLYLYYL